jgi:cytochrome c oxidase accessory protein FixG
MKLDKAPLSLNKAARKAGKHVVWLLIAFATGGAFILYWHDAPTLAQTFFSGQAPMTAYVFAALLTGTTYALAGTMREQVCTYMCPWPRIQAAMTDKETLIITYRSERGEPRGPHKKGEPWEGRGDCVDCTQCVVVCPMGIDIRDGLQLECIQCGLCIDACDAVMKKIGRPTGLVAYGTDDRLSPCMGKAKTRKPRFIRPRTVVYSVALIFTALIMVAGLSLRSDMDLSVLKDRGASFVQLITGDIRNAYTLKVINKTHVTRDLMISIEGLPGASVEIIGAGDETANGHLAAAPDVVERLRLLVTASPGAAAGGRDIRLVLTDSTTGARMSAAARFEAPEIAQ